MLETFVSNVKSRRQAKGWSQTMLADHAGISVASVKLLETLKSWPTLDTICSIAKALECEPFQLLVSPDSEHNLPNLNEILRILEGYRNAGPLRRALVAGILLNDEAALDQFQNDLTALRAVRQLQEIVKKF